MGAHQVPPQLIIYAVVAGLGKRRHCRVSPNEQLSRAPTLLEGLSRRTGIVAFGSRSGSKTRHFSIPLGPMQRLLRSCVIEVCSLRPRCEGRRYRRDLRLCGALARGG